MDCFVGRLITHLSLFAAVVLTGIPAMAHKLNFDVGFFSISATPPTNTGLGPIALSGFGLYSLSGSFAVLPSLEVGAGYTVFFTKVLQGDMGFGPDFSLNYFPITRSEPLRFGNERVQYTQVERYRPYIDLAFHQRQFQSAQSAFSGFGVGGGLEWQYSAASALRASVRSMNLLGPSEAKFNSTDVLVGLQLQF